jgi:hypothetical protein
MAAWEVASEEPDDQWAVVGEEADDTTLDPRDAQARSGRLISSAIQSANRRAARPDTTTIVPPTMVGAADFGPAMSTDEAYRDWQTERVDATLARQRRGIMAGRSLEEKQRAAAQPAEDIAPTITPLPEATAAERAGQRIGKSAGTMARGVAQGQADVAGQMWGLIQAAADVIPGADRAAEVARLSRQSAQEIAEGVGEGRGGLDSFIQAGTRGAMMNLPSLLLGGATRAVGAGLPAALGLFGVQAFGAEYGQGRDAGLEPGPAMLRAAALAIPEVATELLPTERLLKLGSAAARGELEASLRAAAQMMVAEIPGEQINTIAQFIADKAPATGLNPNAGIAELQEQLAETLYQTLAQTAVMGGAGVGGAALLRRKPTAADMPRDRGLVADAMKQRAEDTDQAQEAATIAAITNPATTVDQAIHTAIAAVSEPSAVEVLPPDIDELAAAGLESPVAPAEPPGGGGLVGAEMPQWQGTPTRMGEAPTTITPTVQGQPAPVQTAAPSAIDEAAHEAATSPQNGLPEPTEAQKEAGNYQKGHARIAGLDISIENPAGSKRREEWPTLRSHYGYIRRTEGADGDHVDAFIKPGTPENWSGTVFVVDQVDANKDAARFDEHKVMLGFGSVEEARQAYLENYTPDWQGLRAITPVPVEQFRQWLATGDTKRPIAGQIGEQPTTPEGIIAKAAQLSGADGLPQPPSAEKPSIPGAEAGGTEGLPQPPRPQPPPKKGGATKDRLASVREHFAPGNVVFDRYWRSYDRVLAFNEDGRGGWSVTVEKVARQPDGTWKAVEPPRQHSTAPDRGDRVEQKAAQPPPVSTDTMPTPEQKGAADATDTQRDETGVPGEREAGDRSGQAAETGGGDRLLGEAQGAEGQAEAAKPLTPEARARTAELRKRLAVLEALKECLTT